MSLQLESFAKFHGCVFKQFRGLAVGKMDFFPIIFYSKRTHLQESGNGRRKKKEWFLFFSVLDQEAENIIHKQLPTEVFFSLEPRNPTEPTQFLFSKHVDNNSVILVTKKEGKNNF